MNERTFYRALIIRPLVLLGLPLLVLGGYRCINYQKPESAQVVEQESPNQTPQSQQTLTKSFDRSRIDEASLSRIVRYGLDTQENGIVEITKRDCEAKKLGKLLDIQVRYTDHRKDIDIFQDPEDGEKYAGAIRKEIEDSQKFFACDLLPEADVEILIPRTTDEIYSSRLQSFDFDERVVLYIVPDIRHKFSIDVNFKTDRGLILGNSATLMLSEYFDPRIDYLVLKTDSTSIVRQVRGGSVCSTRIMGQKDNEAAVIQSPVATVLISQFSTFVSDFILDDIESGIEPEQAKRRHIDRSHRLACILTSGWFGQKYGKRLTDEEVPRYTLLGFDPIVSREALELRNKLKSGDRGAVRELIQRFREEPNYLSE